MTPLCVLAKKYGTDKFHPHNYTQCYYNLLAPRREQIKRVVEIGIRYGASLRMWRDFFPNAQIIGIDRNPGYFITEDRIRCHYGNQAKPEKLTRLFNELGAFDVIIDDGSHNPKKQINAMGALLPFLRDDGIYFIEDICGAGDIKRMQEQLPVSFASHVYVGSKPHPKHGREKMLIIWRPNKLAPRFDG